MTLKTRRFIALFFIALFLISAPILIVYTAGYRYNLKKGTLQKTGALIIATQPKGATVTLNNKETDEKTPIRLNNLLPDTYEISLNKELYYPWSKKLDIRPQETTFIEDVILFYQAEPELLTENEINWLNFSPAGNFAVFSTTQFNQDYLYLLNLSNSKIKLLYNDDQKFIAPTAHWSTDGSKLIFQTNGSTILATTFFPQQVKNISARIKTLTPDSLRWDQLNNDLFYGLNANKLYQFNTLTENLELLYAGDPNLRILDFYVFDNAIYTIEKLNAKTIINKHPLSLNNNYSPKTIELKNTDYRFDRFYRDQLGFWNTENHDYYLIDSELNNITFTKNNVHSVSLHPQKNLLLIQTNQELSFLDLDNSSTEKTITRYSHGLQSAIWHPDSTNYCLAIQDNKIQIIELDERQNHFIITLPSEEVLDFAINKKADYLIFLKNKQLWQLPLEK